MSGFAQKKRERRGIEMSEFAREKREMRDRE